MAIESVVSSDFEDILRNLYSRPHSIAVGNGATLDLANGLPGFYHYVTFMAFNFNTATTVTIKDNDSGQIFQFVSVVNTLYQFNFGLLPLRLAQRGSTLQLSHSTAGAVFVNGLIVGFNDDREF